MTFGAQSVFAMLVVGLVIGGIAAFVFRGNALVTNLIGGIVGSFAGNVWLPDLFSVRLYDPIASNIVFGTIGAIIVVVGVRLIGMLPIRLGR